MEEDKRKVCEGPETDPNISILSELMQAEEIYGKVANENTESEKEQDDVSTFFKLNIKRLTFYYHKLCRSLRR